MKVGFLSPMPPARTGVADYSAALLSALQQTCPAGSAIPAGRDADVWLYHLGNNQLHRAIYCGALETPGVVVLHDAVLHHFFLGSLAEREYIAEFVYNYGSWSEDLARELWRSKAHSGTDARYFHHPMLKRIAERSLAVVVHNPRAAAMVAEHAPNARVHEIPHLFAPPELPAASEVIRLRQQLGLAAGTCLFGVFGHLRESKRIAAVLRAFERARRASPMALLVAGEFASSDLARSLEAQLAGDGILRIGYLSERDFWLYASAVDACINLRYPSAGETSGISIRLMGIGKPVIVSASPENAGFPDDACLHVDSGVAEEEMLAEYMVWLARCPTDAAAIGARAASYVCERHAPAEAARLYWRVLQTCYHGDT